MTRDADIADAICFVERHPHTVTESSCDHSRGVAEAVAARLDYRDRPSVEPAGLDVERLARAMFPLIWDKVPMEGNSPESVAEAEESWAAERDDLREQARIIAARYALPTQASDSPEPKETP